jgi:hypothetical protein
MSPHASSVTPRSGSQHAPWTERRCRSSSARAGIGLPPHARAEARKAGRWRRPAASKSRTWIGTRGHDASGAFNSRVQRGGTGRRPGGRRSNSAQMEKCVRSVSRAPAGSAPVDRCAQIPYQLVQGSLGHPRAVAAAATGIIGRRLAARLRQERRRRCPQRPRSQGAARSSRRASCPQARPGVAA